MQRFRSAPLSGAGQGTLPRCPIELAELLGRAPIDLDTPELQRFLAGKRVLITGAGGSIGSEICRQTMRFCPQRLILLERAENNLFEIDRELRHTWIGADIRPCIGDVTDTARVRQVFETEQPQVIFHCAAHKHVPLMEAHPCEAIKNNIFGTKVVADASVEFGVTAFVLVSTDKAVNPTSAMGATKRFAELYVQSLNEHPKSALGMLECEAPGASPSRLRRNETGMRSGTGTQLISAPGSLAPHRPVSPSCPTRFLAVRFGNVLGSSGSVVPIFQKQIEAGGPVTVTHPDMRRFFMTIPEASQLVMQAGAIGRGGEIFVLDMGQQIRILDLAMELIRRNGLRPHDDIEIRFTGIRPGEKLYEELANDAEQTRPTAHPRIRVWELPAADARQVNEDLDRLVHAAASGDAKAGIAALTQSVSEYRADSQSIPRPLRLVRPDLSSEAA